MKHIIFRIIIILWSICPFKHHLSKLIKKNNFFFNKLYKDLRYKGVTIVKISNKKFKLYNPGFTTIENEIFWRGADNGWEKVSLSLLGELAINSNTILDIGANTGIYSFVANALNHSATIYAFEPVKRTVHIFKKNIELNPRFNIFLFEKAISNKNGKATFYDVETESQYSASLNENMLTGIANRVSYNVKTISLYQSSEFNNRKIDLIKLDVEMHEPEAIEGMIEIIKKDMPSILIEILNDEIGVKIENLISNFNYFYFSIDEVNKPFRVKNFKKTGFYNFLLCEEEVAHELNLNCEI